MSAKHTPGPWVLDDWHYQQAGRESVPVIRTSADAIAEVLPLWSDSRDREDERLANAARIVECVNGYDEILGLLHETLPLVDQESENFGGYIEPDGVARLKELAARIRQLTGGAA